jgi:protein translocase SecG subunit
MLYSFLITLHIIVALLLIFIILMQKGKDGGGLGGLVGGYSQTIFGTQKGNVLTKTTTILAITFIVISFLLTFIKYETKSIVRDYDPTQMQPPVQEQETLGIPLEQTDKEVQETTEPEAEIQDNVIDDGIKIEEEVPTEVDESEQIEN